VHKTQVSLCSWISSGTLLCKTVITSWRCKLIPENMMTFQCIIKNYCHRCCGMILCGLTSAHEHWMQKVSKSCLFCVQHEGGETDKKKKIYTRKNMIPGRLPKKLLRGWACTHGQCWWCLCAHSGHISFGYLLPSGMCIHWSSLAQKNDFTYAATLSVAVPLSRRQVNGISLRRLKLISGHFIQTWGSKEALGQDFLRVLQFPLPVSVHQHFKPTFCSSPTYAVWYYQLTPYLPPTQNTAC
jgi:hypothetical protein